MARMNRIGLVGIVFAAFGQAACGGGGGDTGGSFHAVTTRLIVGTRLLPDNSSRAVILRSVGGKWESVGDAILDERGLGGVVFASHDEAFAYGGRFLRSTDAGRTWEDVQGKLPEEVDTGPHVLRSLAFADARSGYLATYRVDDLGFPRDGPFVWATRDGGEHWDRVDDVPVVQGEVGFEVAVRDGVPEMLRHPATGAIGAVVAPFDGADFDVQTVATSAAVIRQGFRAVGERGWVAFGVAPGEDVAHIHPAILTSARPGAPWIPQQLPDVPPTDFGELDMCDATVGVAGGTEANGDFFPVVLWTDDGGTAWHESDVPGKTPGFALSDLLCVRPREILMVTTDFRTFERSALFESTDGGRSFTRVSVPFEDRSQLFGLASNARY